MSDYFLWGQLRDMFGTLDWIKIKEDYELLSQEFTFLNKKEIILQA